ncbi:MAG: Uma2 family endonuclease [Jaaginema sp. PMC 1079.18]|nr:Uma2 family endonuclease [Jaaginema sp. PMC 1080.18]MEC4853326.1 Uma2 family endonuclease [Jaaginema sp. PMC 1079.18]MEC4868993.1 Uma2 family endonuclease [Jaaginema sp. PMC 1078.18]
MTVFSPPTHSTVLSNVRWQTYQALALDLAQTAGKRLTYDRGQLEIMTPLPEHEVTKRLLGRFVEATTEVLGIEIYSLGSTTWSREDLQRGLEPDECYYITQEAVVRGQLNFDLSVDPPPDLAIEIEITSSSLDRLSIYAALGIAEVWRFDSQDLTIYVLREGVYEVQERSQVLSVLTRSDLRQFWQRRGTMGENALLREFRNWLTNRDRDRQS